MASRIEGSRPRGSRRTKPECLSRRGFGAGLAAFGLTARAAGAAEADVRLEALTTLLDGHAAGGDPPGLVAAVRRGGATITYAAGARDREARLAMEPDTLCAVASLTKPVTAACVLALAEEGALGLDDPVDRWLPELADRRVIRDLAAPLDATTPAERPITPRDLLTMRMGLGAVFADPAGSPLLLRMAELELAPSEPLFPHGPDEFMRRVGSLPLMHQPGAGWRYHTGLDVAGVLVSRVAGRPLSAVMRERLLGPLGMAETGFAATGDAAARLATIYRRGPEDALERWTPPGDGFAAPPVFESGGAGLVSTVADFSAFGAMLLAGGVHDGRRLLSEASVVEMTRDQIGQEEKAASPFFPGFWERFGWGLGLAVTTAPDDISPAGRFGWWGGYGTTFFVDPATATVATLFMQRLMQGPDDAALSDAFLRVAFAPD